MFTVLTCEETHSEVDVEQSEADEWLAYLRTRRGVKVSYQVEVFGKPGLKRGAEVEITTGQLCQSFAYDAWLRDEVFAIYHAVLDKFCRETRPDRPVALAHPFFYERLTGGGKYSYGKVRKWSHLRKYGPWLLASCVLVTVHVNANHWVLVKIVPAELRIYYYDSILRSDRGKSGEIFQNLLRLECACVR